jgi:hypothetical protein
MIDRAIEGLLGSAVVRAAVNEERQAASKEADEHDDGRERCGWREMPEGPSPLDTLLDSLKDAIFE